MTTPIATSCAIPLRTATSLLQGAEVVPGDARSEIGAQPGAVTTKPGAALTRRAG